MPACAMVHPPPLKGLQDCVAGRRIEGRCHVVVVDTIQAPVPLHPPPFHPANRIPALGVAVNVTVVPPANGSLQYPRN